MPTVADSTSRERKRISQSPLPTEDSQSLPNLPCEIIGEILLRLPVKSLLRLTCVCKSWRSLISNPKFAKTHLSLASMNTDYTNHRLIVSSYLTTDVKSCSVYSILNEKSDIVVHDCPWKKRNDGVVIWGCCDGLVCIGTYREVFIWNPSTRKYKGLLNGEMSDSNFAKFGFGYDEFIDDYKVVGFFSDNFGASEPKAKVYSLRTDSWRRIGDCPHCSSLDKFGTFVNGALHWMHRAESVEYDTIVSLDLVKETYGEISKPEYRRVCSDDELVGALNGCLCMLCNYCKDGFDLWIMKEYGIKDSWTKLFAIPYASRLSHCSYFALVCNWEDVGDTRLIRYNPKDDTFSYLVMNHYSPSFTGKHLYIESLVSPDSDAHNGVQYFNANTKGKKGKTQTDRFVE